MKETKSVNIFFCFIISIFGTLFFSFNMDDPVMMELWSHHCAVAMLQLQFELAAEHGYDAQLWQDESYFKEYSEYQDFDLAAYDRTHYMEILANFQAQQAVARAPNLIQVPDLIELQAQEFKQQPEVEEQPSMSRVIPPRPLIEICSQIIPPRLVHKELPKVIPPRRLVPLPPGPVQCTEVVKKDKSSTNSYVGRIMTSHTKHATWAYMVNKSFVGGFLIP